MLASRLGYRITAKFVHTFFGRVFDNPTAVFTEEILKPETQDPAVFADGVNNIVEAQQRMAEAYFADGTIEDACPPLKALLHIMAHGQFEGKDANHPEVRALFTREALLASDWYHERLAVKQQRDMALWERHVRSLTEFLARAGHRDEAERLGIARPARACPGRAGAGERPGVSDRPRRHHRGRPDPPAVARAAPAKLACAQKKGSRCRNPALAARRASADLHGTPSVRFRRISRPSHRLKLCVLFGFLTLNIPWR